MTQTERRSHESRKAATRDKLVQATIAEINKKGVVGLRTKEIAQAAGVSWGAAQHLFGDKTELLLYTIKSVTDSIISKRRVAVDPALPLSERVDHIVDEAWCTHRMPEAQAVMELLLAKRDAPDLLRHEIPLVRAAEFRMRAIYCDILADTGASDEKIKCLHDIIALTLGALARREKVMLHQPNTIKATLDLLKEMVLSALLDTQNGASVQN